MTRLRPALSRIAAALLVLAVLLGPDEGGGAPRRRTRHRPRRPPATTTRRPPREPVEPTVPGSSALAILPPPTAVIPVADTLHGEVIVDPYRWLEDDAAPEVRQWVDAQNAYTQAMLSAYPGREVIRKRLTELLRIGMVTAPTPRSGRYFFERREGDQNQPALYVRNGLAGEPRVLIDPNTLSPDGTTALDWWYPSRDGRLVAYGTSRNGDERSTLRIRNVETGSDLPDSIPDTRAATVAWEPGAGAFFYTRYPAKGSVPEGEENYHRIIYRHRLGDAPAADSLVFGKDRAREDWPDVDLSKNGRWLVANVSVGWSRNDLYLKDLSKPASRWTPLVEKIDAVFNVQVAGDTLYIVTNQGAPRFHVFKVAATSPARAKWREIIPQSDDVLQSATFAGGKIVALYLSKAASALKIFSPDGVLEKDLALPAPGTVDAVDAEPDGAEAFFSFSSYFIPPSVFRYDFHAGSLEKYDAVAANIDPSPYEVEQLWYMSADKTFVSMFVAHRKDLKLNGQNPTLLTGYGGFNVAITPTFERNSFLWLERGGVLAVANLRGGSEYGESWHQGGMLANKQNTFDDFIAAADFLVKRQYTSPRRLAIEGGSNGGLLVGAALTQRPDLFRAVVCQVPLLDMLRYHKFLIARLWVPEYGSADDPEQFKYLLKYSPYQNVKDGTRYPAVLLTASESDSRVAPLHARKMAARLQAATSSGLPVLLRLETKAGHGQGKPVTKMIDEYTDVWTFVFMMLGIAA